MIEEIIKVLKELIGLKVTNILRLGYGIEIIIGDRIFINKDGIEFNECEFAFHIEIPWRFTSKTEIIVGSRDVIKPIDENAPYEENFDPFGPNGNLRDYKFDILNKNFELIVQDVKIDNYGGFELYFNNDITFSVFPNETPRIGDEHWRLLDFRNSPLDEEASLRCKRNIFDCEQFVYWSSKKDFEDE
jgi:hypothetical protein